MRLYSAAGPVLLAALFTACANLDVENPNAPDIADVLSTPEAVTVTATGSVNAWWLGATHYYPNLMLQVAADALTSNTCLGTRFNNLEPRIAFNNSVTDGDAVVALRPWEVHYKALDAAVDALRALDRGVISNKSSDAYERARSAALFTQAATHSSLAMLFDQAFVKSATESSGTLSQLRPYPDVRDAAIAAWDELIALTAGKSWQWEVGTLPLTDGPPTAARIHRVARTMAARTLVLSARTAAENASTNWARVLAYADGGITGTGVPDMDFGVVEDVEAWYDYIKLYGALPSWVRTDQRLIKRMASNIPASFNGLANQPLPVPEDNRLALANLPCGPDPVSCVEGIDADYVYTGTVIGDVSRGIFLQSPFWHRRWIRNSFNVDPTVRMGEPNVHVLAAENDLMIAEALVRTGGNLSRAAALVNKTHVGRGGRTPVATNPSALLAAIEYERDVELLNTGGIALYDRRRVDGLMAGTPRHLPVPARELETMGLPVYTFGGFGQPDM